MGRIDWKKKQKRESLFNSAFHLFTENGFSETSISDIVKDAGVAKGTFYLYFTDKFDLRNKLIADLGSRVFLNAYQALDEEQIVNVEDQVIFLTDHILDQFAGNKPLVGMLAKHLTWNLFKNSIIEAEKNMDDPAAKAFKELIDRLNKHYSNPELMIYLVMEFVSSTAYSPILFSSPCTLDDLKPHIHDIVKYMIRREQLPDPAASESDETLTDAPMVSTGQNQAETAGSFSGEMPTAVPES